jgi:outer membrane protein TolC
MRHLTLLLIGVALAAPARAQTDPLTLRGALELARENSPSPAIAAGRLQIVAGAARERAAPANPTLELREESVGGSMLREQFTTVTLPLDLTFRRAALRAVAREQIGAATADSLTLVRELDASVGAAFWRLSLADALAEAAAAQAAAMEEIASFEETRLREGAVAEAVVLRTRLEADRARIALARARAESARAHARLAETIGVPAATLPTPHHPRPPGHWRSPTWRARSSAHSPRAPRCSPRSAEWPRRGAGSRRSGGRSSPTWGSSSARNRRAESPPESSPSPSGSPCEIAATPGERAPAES